MGFGPFSSDSKSEATDNRIAATDKARVQRGSGKIIEKGATDLSKAKFNTGVQVGAGGKLNTGTINKKTVAKKTTQTVIGNKGSVTIGDPDAAKTVSTTATSLSDSFLKALGDQNAANQATLVTTLTNVTANKSDSGAADSLTSKFLHTLQSFKPADNGGSVPTIIQVPTPGATATSGPDLGSFINRTVDNSFSGVSSGGDNGSASQKQPWLWIALSAALVGLVFLFLRRMR